jgi:HEAT repeat protein
MNRQTLAHSRLFLVASILSLVTLTKAFAQPTSGVRNVRLSRFGDLLRQHNIELTQPALIRALKNPDPEVRFLAAMKLSEEKAIDAIPAGKEALATEEVPRTRVNIAVALGLLGDSGGPDELKGLCADQDFPSEFRLYAVRYMFDLHVENDTQCLHAAEQIVQTVDADYHTSAYRTMALGLLPQFRSLTPEESERVFQLVVERLDDPEPYVRVAASAALVNLGNPAAVSYLEAAIVNEQDENNRSLLEANVSIIMLWDAGQTVSLPAPTDL